MGDANVRAVITAEDKASGVLKGFGDNVNSFSAGMVAKGILIADAIEGAAKQVIGFGVSSIKAFSESQNLIAQTNAALASTAGVAGITADKVTELATAWQKQTRYSDEAVRGAENVLLTFTAIGKDKFPQATEAVLNLATAMHEDLQSASVQVGKALQDPILGITALRRVGVNFNDAQKEVVKNLVETGHQAEAQALILKELQKEFGGSAVAAGKTLSGALDRLKNNFNDGQESLGQYISKGLTPLINRAADVLVAIDWTATINKTIAAIKDLWINYLQPIAKTIEDVAIKIYDYLKPKFEALINTITAALPTLKQLYDQVLVPLGKVIGEVIVIAVGLFIDAVNLLITTLTPVIQLMLDNKDATVALALVFGTLAVAMNISGIVNGMSAAITTLTTTASGATTALTGLVASVGGVAAAVGIVAFAAVVVAAVVGISIAAKDARAALDKLADSQVAAGNSFDDAVKKINSSNLPKDQKARMIQSLANDFSGRAIGGPVTDGTPYIVGEEGPELFVPNQSGKILPNGQSMGNSTVNINVNAGALMGTDVEARKFAQIIMSHLRDLASSKNQTVGQLMGY